MKRELAVKLIEPLAELQGLLEQILARWKTMPNDLIIHCAHPHCEDCKGHGGSEDSPCHCCQRGDIDDVELGAGG